MLIHLLLVAIFVSAIIGFTGWKCYSLPLRLLVVQLCTALIVEVLAKYFIRNNIGLYNIYILLEVIFVGLAGGTLFKRKLPARLAFIGLGICIVIWCGNIFFIQGQDLFANKAFLTNCIFITSLYIGIMLQTAAISLKLVREPSFWLSLAHILYFGCVIPFFSMYDYFTRENPQLGGKLYVLNNIVAIARYSLICLAFILQRRAIRM